MIRTAPSSSGETETSASQSRFPVRASHPNVRPPVDTSSPGTLPSSTLRSSSRPTTSTGGSPGRTTRRSCPAGSERSVTNQPSCVVPQPVVPGSVGTRSPDADSTTGPPGVPNTTITPPPALMAGSWSDASACRYRQSSLPVSGSAANDDDAPVLDDGGGGQPGQDRERGHRGCRMVGQHVSVGEVEHDDARPRGGSGVARERGGTVGHQADHPFGLGARLGIRLADRRARVRRVGLRGIGAAERCGPQPLALCAGRARRRTASRPGRRARRAGRRARPARRRASRCPGRPARARRRGPRAGRRPPAALRPARPRRSPGRLPRAAPRRQATRRPPGRPTATSASATGRARPARRRRPRPA